MSELVLNRDQFLELQKIGIGAFAPLSGFMNEDDFRSVADNLRLSDGTVFPLPVYLDVTADTASRLKGGSNVALIYEGEEVGELRPESTYKLSADLVARKVFGVAAPEHPGARRMLAGSGWVLGGPITLHPAGRKFLFAEEMSPAQTRAEFSRRGWKTIAGFQTRNVPHRAHEYLQRVALEICEGLFIQPLLGRKKTGDYTPEAVMAGYRALVTEFLPRKNVLLGILSTAMRYAGPREALFHAIIRRNYGCTHFIIGRDHAGVGSYYGKYDAQMLAKKYESEIGISILDLHGPFHCSVCNCIVTEKTCPHVETRPSAVTEISGTLMRQILNDRQHPRPELMRPEIVAAISNTKMFTEEDD